MGLFGGGSKRRDPVDTSEDLLVGEATFSGLFSQEGLPAYDTGIFTVSLTDAGVEVTDRERNTYLIARGRIQDIGAKTGKRPALTISFLSGQGDERELILTLKTTADKKTAQEMERFYRAVRAMLDA